MTLDDLPADTLTKARTVAWLRRQSLHTRARWIRSHPGVWRDYLDAYEQVATRAAGRP